MTLNRPSWTVDILNARQKNSKSRITDKTNRKKTVEVICCPFRWLYMTIWCWWWGLVDDDDNYDGLWYKIDLSISHLKFNKQNKPKLQIYKAMKNLLISF